jgi:hypothetical protein
MEKLYSPPSGDRPQNLPDYWKFENGVIRTDLQTLEDEELHAWGWHGPFYLPVSKRVIKNTEELSVEYVNTLMNDKSFKYDENDEEWSSVEYDYDTKTHKVVWYSKNREFVILPIEQDTTEYDLVYKSVVNFPQPEDVKLFPSPEDPIIPTYNLDKPPTSWEPFRNELVSSLKFNQYISTITPIFPIVAASFPIALLQLELGKYSLFKTLWETLKGADLLPSSEVIERLVEISNKYNAPQDFLNILES